MPTDELERFAPDYATPPGESLRQTLEALQMTQAELAERAQLSTKHINQIIQGFAPITPETSIALERVTGAPASFWNNLEANFQLARARSAEVAEADAEREWVASFPLAELRKRQVIESERDYMTIRQQLLAFFGVASPAAWHKVWASPTASFRRSRAYSIDHFATACWLRLGELEAIGTDTEPFDAQRFRKALTRVRRSMTDPPAQFGPVMRESCAAAGVALTFVDEIKGSRANGAVRWLTPIKAVLQLSVRYKWEDHFWFSFFHEAGHILLHGKREAFVEIGEGATSERELEADDFARRWLIPPDDADRLEDLHTDQDIKRFAAELRLPPAVVVGRLHHDRLLPYTRGHRLRRQFHLVATGDS